MDVSEAVRIDFEEILKETDKALQVKFSSENVCWLPKSQCRIINKTIFLPEWLAKEKGVTNEAV